MKELQKLDQEIARLRETLEEIECNKDSLHLGMSAAADGTDAELRSVAA